MHEVPIFLLIGAGLGWRDGSARQFPAAYSVVLLIGPADAHADKEPMYINT